MLFPDDPDRFYRKVAPMGNGRLDRWLAEEKRRRSLVRRIVRSPEVSAAWNSQQLGATILTEDTGTVS